MVKITTVFLHGLLGDRQDWEPVIRDLPGPVLTLDLPGHGANHALRVTDFAECNEWLRATLSRHGIRHYRLAGYSLGGRIALYHASQAPDGLQALWLENCHPGLVADERPARIVHDGAWANRFASEPMTEVLASWYRQPVFAELDEQARQRLIARRSHNHGPAVAAMLQATSLGQQPDLRHWLQHTRLPVTYLSGMRDQKFHRLACQLATPDSTIDHQVLEGGHNLHAACPDTYARLLCEWVTQPEEKRHD
mgnify:CR=1 FL=1